MLGQEPIKLTVDHPSINWQIDGRQGVFGGEPYILGPITGEFVKVDDGVSVPTDTDTWTPMGWYGCDSLINGAELAGKIGFISRGACEFGVKLLNAQEQGVTAGIIGNRAPIGQVVGTHNPGLIIMNGGVVGDMVTMPGIFISYEDREAIDKLMLAGETVNVTVETSFFYEAAAAYAYQTPQSQITSLDAIQLVVVNRDTNIITDVAFTATVSDPSGNEVELSAVRVAGEVEEDLVNSTIDTMVTAGSVATGGGEYQIFFESYTPSEIGTYTVSYSASTLDGNHPIDAETMSTSFQITDLTFAHENGALDDVGGVAMFQKSYQDSLLIYNVGSIFRTGSDAATVQYASFGLANPEVLNLGSEFHATIYQMTIDTTGAVVNETPTAIVAQGTYTFTGEVLPNTQIPIEFLGGVTLDPNSAYVVMIESDGFIWDNFESPAYTTGTGNSTVGLSTAMRLGAGWDMAGFEYWNGGGLWPHNGRRPTVRLHLEGFVPTEEAAFDKGTITLAPNPVSHTLNVDFELIKMEEAVEIIVFDITGQPVLFKTINQVQSDNISLEINHLAVGAYFMNIVGADGMKTLKFMVAR